MAQPERKLEMRRVESPADEDIFHSFRSRLYRDDPGAVEPLKAMARGALDATKNAFFEHATRESWVCLENGQCVGRIAAIVDDLHNQHCNDNVGFFGFFECVQDVKVARELVDTARDWLAERGKTSMRGPVSPSMKGEFGVVVEGNEKRPSVMMTHSFKYYDNLLKECGFEVVRSFYAFEIESDDTAHEQKYAKLAKFEARVRKRFPDLKIEHATKVNFEETVRDVNRLANTVRSEGWGFVPMTDGEVDTMIRNIRSVIRYDMFYVARYHGQLVGFIITIPDINWALKKTFFKNDFLRKLELLFWLRFIPRGRVIALGVDPAFRNKGIAMLLINRLVNVRRAYKEWEFSWVLDDNVKSLRAIERSVNLSRCRTIQMYQKEI
jgi:GNAT superfamily N-acetyltransferase